jgi:hypothetical protein
VWLQQDASATAAMFGTSQAYAYPFTGMVFRQSLLQHQHNLAPLTFVTALDTLSFNLAMGYQLAHEFDWMLGNAPAAMWWRPVSALQQLVLPLYTTELVTGFDRFPANASMPTVRVPVLRWLPGQP